MKEDLHILEQMDRYLEGSLDDANRVSFESALSSDADLADLFEASQVAEQVVVGYEVLKLREQMTKDLAKPKSNKGKYLLGVMLFVGVAAGTYFIRSERKGYPIESVNNIVRVKEKSEDVPKKRVLAVEKATKFLLPERSSKEKTVSQNGVPLYLTNEKESNSKEVSIEKVADLKPQSEVETVVVSQIPCENVKIEFDYYSIPVCKGDNNGAVHVKMETLKGGRPPYAFSINNEMQKSTGVFSGLEAGSYLLYVEDANECVASKNIVVQQKSCKVSKEFSFNPAYDSPWNIPYDINKKPKSINILDKSGREVYQSEVMDFVPSEWNGESNTGITIGVGYHLYFIEYTDGSADKGSITILR